MNATFPAVGSIFDELVDVAIVTIALVVLIRLLRHARARLAFVGVVLVGLVDLAARQLGLPLTAWLFQGLFLVSIVVLLLAFQDDLKRLFERLAVWGLGRRRPPPGETTVDALVRATLALAALRRGALIVLPGREPLDRHLVGGVYLDGAVSEALLLSLFDPHSPGHDGAVLLEGTSVRRFGVHLPLSVDLAQLTGRGTRHAAALGLAERCDALVVVVSEERGTTSLAHDGRLVPIGDGDELRARIVTFSGEVRPAPERRRPLRRTLAALGEWTAALFMAAALWLLVVFGGASDDRVVPARVAVAGLPPGYVVRSVIPATVSVTVSGPRRDLFFMKPDDVVVSVDAFLTQFGRHTFDVSTHSVRVPSGIIVRAVEPEKVTLEIATPPAE
jgi:DNA integrity scanning protein DisA with diadenylate cyclase activity